MQITTKQTFGFSHVPECIEVTEFKIKLVLKCIFFYIFHLEMHEGAVHFEGKSIPFFFCKLGFFFPLKSVDEYARNVCMNACKNDPILKQIILALFYKLSFSFAGFSKKVTQKTGAKLCLIPGTYYPFFTITIHPPILKVIHWLLIIFQEQLKGLVFVL